MSDTFERVMENKTVNGIKSKLQLMTDLAALLRQRDRYENKEVFFFILEPKGDEELNELDDGADLESW